MKRIYFLGLFILALSACDDAVPFEVETESFLLSLVGGNEQAGFVGEELNDPLVVQVTQTFRNKEFPVPNHLVNFVPTEGGGSVFAGASLTSFQGTAQDYWTLGAEGCDPIKPCNNRLEVRSVDPITGEKQVFGTFEALALPRVIPVCPQAAAVDINNADQVVGEFPSSTGNPLSFLFWTPSSGCAEVSRSGGIFSIRSVAGISDLGTVAATIRWRIQNDYGTWYWADQAAIWAKGTSGGEWTVLGGLPVTGGEGDSQANDINNLGQVVGSSRSTGGYSEAFLWTDGVMKGLGSLEANQHSIAQAINDHGQIAGRVWTPSGYRAVYWNAEGVIQDLEVPGKESYAVGINNSGTVVGYSFTPGGPWIMFFWTEDGGLAFADPPAENCAAIPAAINDAGEVVGSLIVVDYNAQGRCGSNRSFTWTVADGFIPLPQLEGDSPYPKAINTTGQIVGGLSGNAVLWYPKVTYFR